MRYRLRSRWLRPLLSAALCAGGVLHCQPSSAQSAPTQAEPTQTEPEAPPNEATAPERKTAGEASAPESKTTDAKPRANPATADSTAEVPPAEGPPDKGPAEKDRAAKSPTAEGPAEKGRAAARSKPDPELRRTLRRVLESRCSRGVDGLRALASGRGRREAGHGPDRIAEIATEVLTVCETIARDEAARRASSDGSQREEATPPPSGDDRSPAGGRARAGRAVLVTGSAIYGLWAGIAVDILGEVDDARVGVLIPLLGVGGGLGLSLAATGEGRMTKGEAWTILTGMDYGTYTGLLLAITLDTDSAQGVVGTMLLSGAVGTALATALATEHSPARGTAEAVRSGGLWGFSSAALVAAMLEDPSARATAGLMLAGMGGGLATGGLVASNYPVTRDRMLLADAGALSGAVLGAGLYVLIAGSPDDQGRGRVLAASTLVGLHAGLVTSLWLTRGWADSTDDEVAPAAASQALYRRDDAGNWAPGSLTLVPTFERGPASTRLVGGWVPLVGGHF